MNTKELKERGFKFFKLLVLRDFSTFLMVTTFVPLRKLERVFHCCSVCETMEHHKEGYLIIMVWTNYMSLLAALLLGYTLR